MTVFSTRWAALPLLCWVTAMGQAPEPRPESRSAEFTRVRPEGATASASKSEQDRVLGAHDQVTIWALGVSEIPEKPLPIDDEGMIDVPMIGRTRAAGLTVSKFREELIEKLRNYVNSPQVSVTVVETHSRPVSVIGAVNHPGVYQLGSEKTVLEVLSVAGGFTAEAGRWVTVRRDSDSPCPPLLHESEDGSYSISEIGIKELISSKNADSNLPLCAHDVVTVARADVVYVVGEVQKPGAFPLTERASYTVLQALTMAGGLTPTAASRNSRILRDTQATGQEIHVDLKRLLTARDHDFDLKPGDILFVPNSATKSASRKAIDAAIQLAVGVAIFRQ